MPPKLLYDLDSIDLKGTVVPIEEVSGQPIAEGISGFPTYFEPFLRFLDGKGPVETLPGRFVELATTLRERETARRHPPYSGEVRVGGLRIDVENLLPTVRRLDGEGREFDGRLLRDR